MGRVCEFSGLWPWVCLLVLEASFPELAAAANSVLKAHYDCGEHGLQLVASLVPWPPGDRVDFQILDEFGNAKDVEDCWACQHWVTTGPQGEAVLAVKYTGCYVSVAENRFYLKVRVLQRSASQEPVLLQDIEITCKKPLPGTWVRLLPPPWNVSLNTPPQQEVSTLTPGTSPNLPSVCKVGSGKIPCGGNSSASLDACLRSGCCYDPADQSAPCYYGNKATVLCTPDGFFVVVISRDFVSQSIRLDTAHFADGGAACQPKVATASFRLFRFPLHHCGTIVQMLSDRIVYENTLKSAIDVQHSENGSITRDTAFTLTVRCSYTTSDHLQAVAEVLPLPPPQNIFESGPLRLEMRIAKDALYSAYYTEEEYPIVRVLRDLIFVEVRLLQRTDPSLRLVLDQCWAGPTSNPRQEPQWPILVDGCPFSGDNLPSTTVSLDTSIQFPSHYSRFTAAAFTFVDFTSPLSHGDQVYFFCAASVCHPTAAEQCTPLCPPARGRQKRFLRLVEDKPMNLVVSPGPLILRGKPIVDQKIGSSSLPTSAPLLLTWLPVAAGLATGMAVTLLALSVLCWRKIGQAVFAGTMQK
ncbi:zona pellucida sperm-binding protein 1-like [Lissotriton helveticus]